MDRAKPFYWAPDDQTAISTGLPCRRLGPAVLELDRYQTRRQFERVQIASPDPCQRRFAWKWRAERSRRPANAERRPKAGPVREGRRTVRLGAVEAPPLAPHLSNLLITEDTP
jgi:hypothetical protein